MPVNMGEVEIQHVRLAPFFDILVPEMRDGFRRSFEWNAMQYESGAATLEWFRAVCGELKRDAIGTARNPLYVATPERESDARDGVKGSGGSSVWKRAAMAFVAVAYAVALILIALLINGGFKNRSEVRESVNPSPVASSHVSRSGDMIQGGYWTWEVISECGNGSAACDAVLARVNREAAEFGLFLYEDGSIVPLDMRGA